MKKMVFQDLKGKRNIPKQTETKLYCGWFTVPERVTEELINKDTSVAIQLDCDSISLYLPTWSTESTSFI